MIKVGIIGGSGYAAGELIRIQVWGTWSEHDGVLALDFTHSEDKFPADGSGEGFNNLQTL